MYSRSLSHRGAVIGLKRNASTLAIKKTPMVQEVQGLQKRTCKQFTAVNKIYHNLYSSGQKVEVKTFHTERCAIDLIKVCLVTLF